MKLFSKSLSIGIGVIFFCLVMAAVGRGMGDTFAIFLLPLSNDLGLSRSEAASIYAVYIAAMGAFSPLSGYLFDKFGSRPRYSFGIYLCWFWFWDTFLCSYRKSINRKLWMANDISLFWFVIFMPHTFCCFLTLANDRKRRSG